MKKLWVSLIALLSAIALVGCESDVVSNPFGGSEFDDQPLTIVAATELKDLEPLVQQASDDLGFPIKLEFPAGTLVNSQSLKAGDFDGQVDATWFATNRYVDLIGASGKLADETKIATSPVAFGVWEDSAKRLGWDSKQPTWREFSDAANRGDFTFGMTHPTTSNSGFSALLSVATALADTGSALTSQDIDTIEEPMQQLYQAQAMVSGSSGWLADSFIESPEKVDAIVNYESTLYQLRDEGQPIKVIVPQDGVISADYPLSTLAEPATSSAPEKVSALADWLMEHDEEIAQSYRRPLSGTEALPAELANQSVIELAFPADYAVVEKLVNQYNNDYRNPGSTTFVLDTSGSMEGERLDSLKAIMTSLVDGTASTTTGDVALRDREKVTLWSFGTTPNPPLTQEFSRESNEVKGSLQSYIDGLNADGTTAVYQTLLDALNASDTSGGIPSIVLLSDGIVTAGPNYDGFLAEYNALPQEKKDIPVFVILYGEASVQEMQGLADLTGGEVFDALNGDLDEAFKEIRGFQ
ncbi:VWA domain-containing protein [Corynebacterium breve]|uniref:VWA domain-containing protein n=1 Tax=Corynebacterium breve TaxID=3049799 RepID=A0ABY8VGY8_9CORY|nr:VWA domain-containing protein [Corynebacterium breve]WIM68773.1 VWA domain-containing protein [Corynebacterium breve]